MGPSYKPANTTLVGYTQPEPRHAVYMAVGKVDWLSTIPNCPIHLVYSIQLAFSLEPLSAFNNVYYRTQATLFLPLLYIFSLAFLSADSAPSPSCYLAPPSSFPSPTPFPELLAANLRHIDPSRMKPSKATYSTSHMGPSLTDHGLTNYYIDAQLYRLL